RARRRAGPRGPAGRRPARGRSAARHLRTGTDPTASSRRDDPAAAQPVQPGPPRTVETEIVVNQAWSLGSATMWVTGPVRSTRRCGRTGDDDMADGLHLWLR